MSQRMQTTLIVVGVLGVVVVWGLVTGAFDDTLDDLATIWDYLF